MLTRWNNAWAPTERDPSWDAFSQLRREMDLLFGDFDRGMAPQRRLFDRAGVALELSDNGDALSARMELPGFTEDGIHIDINQNTLTIRGQRKTDVPEGYSVHRQERGNLSFARAVSLPCRVEADGVSAKLRDGVLELHLPKAAEAQPRTIQVRAAN